MGCHNQKCNIAAHSARQYLLNDPDEAHTLNGFVRPSFDVALEMAASAAVHIDPQPITVAQLYPHALRTARAALLHFAALNPGFAGERRLTFLLALPTDGSNVDLFSIVEALPPRPADHIVVQVRR